jgi:hypothetical protein
MEQQRIRLDININIMKDIDYYLKMAINNDAVLPYTFLHNNNIESEFIGALTNGNVIFYLPKYKARVILKG